MKWFKIIVFSLIILLFFYLRLTPIINQTIPYTYDQGRDFLQAEEIIKNRNMTFIGPTTGIQGVYHGAWWYYFLAISYLIFGGWPIGFYLSLLFFSTIAILLFYLFINKEFNWQTAIFFLLVITPSEFFIRLSFFTSNNTLSPLFVLLLIYSVYQFFKTKSDKYLFLISLAIGFIFEFEVAFGIFMIIAYGLTSLFFKQFRDTYLNIKKLLIFTSGFIIPFLPRGLFEVKNHFIQTKALMNYYFHPTTTNQQSLFSTAIDRVHLFINYFLQLIPQQNGYLGILILLLFIGMLLITIKNNKVKSDKKNLLLFFPLLTLFLFSSSLLSRNNFFWVYYLDGIQFIFLFLFIIIFSLSKQLSIVKNILLGVLAINLLFVSYQGIANKNIPLLGLRADNRIVSYFVDKYPDDYFCLRIYTPPIIPFTYYYLFSYYANQQQLKYPKADFYKNQCYFIFDKETYQFRIDKWKEENVPKNSRVIKTIKFENGTNIELRQLN